MSAIPSHTNTKSDGPCPYLVCLNNDLGMIKSRNGISLKYLCQNKSLSQYEDDISLIVLSQGQGEKHECANLIILSKAFIMHL